MKPAVLEKNKKEKESTKPNNHQNWFPHDPSVVLYTFHVHIFKVLKSSKKIHFNTISFK